MIDRSKDNLVLSLTKKDFIIRTFRVPKNGGQKVNKTESGAEIIHPASGAKGRSIESRSQARNKQIALKRLTETPQFLAWVAAVSRGLKTQQELEKEVELSISDPANLKLEIREGKSWKEVSPDELI